MGDRYLHGHHDSVLRAHAQRTAANSAAYLLPHLEVGMSVLDVGCGPATITIDLATRVAPGQVVGIEPTDDVLEIARANAVRADAPEGLTFERADVYALDFPDGTFDVVHAHQVLQHLSDPVAALREMRRVCKPGGFLAVRDADYAAMAWFPDIGGIRRWQQVYRDTALAGGFHPDAGRMLKSWALAAGFEQFAVTGDVWCYAADDDVEWWSSTWADRAVHSGFADQAVERGVIDRLGLQQIREAWQEWGSAPDAWFLIPHAELLARA